MERDDPVETRFKDYLLGQLSASEEQHFEEQLMDNDTLFTRAEGMIDLVEDDLIEEYLKDQLTESERAAFELRLLHSSRIQQKLTLIRALIRKGAERETRSSTATDKKSSGSLIWLLRGIRVLTQPLPALAASLTVILLGGGFWATMRIGLLEDRLAEMQGRQSLLLSSQQGLRAQLTHEQGLTQQLTSQLEWADSRSAALENKVQTLEFRDLPEIPSAMLLPGLLRSSGQMGVVPVSSNHQLIALRLDLGLDEYPYYRAALCDAGGNEIFVQSRLLSSHEGERVLVTAHFPSAQLRSDQYLIKLAGITEAGTPEQLELYHFRLLRK